MMSKKNCGIVGRRGLVVNCAPVELGRNEEREDEDVDSQLNLMSLYSLEVGSGKRHDPVIVTVGINGKQVGMDTGAAVK